MGAAISRLAQRTPRVEQQNRSAERFRAPTGRPMAPARPRQPVHGAEGKAWQSTGPDGSSRNAVHRSAVASRTGLMSMTGVLVQGLQALDADPRHLGGEYPYPVQPDGIGTVGGTGAEDTGERPLRVVARPGDQHLAVGPVQPRQHDDLGVSGDVPQSVRDRGLEDEPGVRCTPRRPVAVPAPARSAAIRPSRSALAETQSSPPHPARYRGVQSG